LFFKLVLGYSLWVGEGVRWENALRGVSPLMFIGWLGQGWEGGSKARSLARFRYKGGFFGK